MRRTDEACDPPVTVALLTPPGRAALAVVGVAGPGAVAAVDRLFTPRGGRPLADRGDGDIAYGTWRPSGEDVVVVRHADDRVEVLGHGGAAAPEAVLQGLEADGAVRARWEACLDGLPCRREALAALPLALGPRAAMILVRQASGALDEALDQLARLHARGDHEAAAGLGRRLLAASRIGLRLTTPWRVMLSGAVNAGKSSLLNALRPGLALEVGRVSDIWQKGKHTTVVPELIALDDGWIADTPGIRGYAIWDVEAEVLDEGFREIAAHIGECAFSDCTHIHERGCAVRASVERGDISRARYESYMKLRDELARQRK